MCDGGRKNPDVSERGAPPGLLTAFAETGYLSRLEDVVLEEQALELVIVRKLERLKTLVLLPTRRVVERTFVWLMRYRCFRAEVEAKPTGT